MFFDPDNLKPVIKDFPNGSELKMFLYIAFKQPDDGIHGYITTKPQLAYDLKLQKTALFDCLKYLKDNLFIHEIKRAEDFDFMANPHYVMNNSDRDARIAEWNRRLALDEQREERLQHDRRLRAFRKAKKQQKNAPT